MDFTAAILWLPSVPMSFVSNRCAINEYDVGCKLEGVPIMNRHEMTKTQNYVHKFKRQEHAHIFLFNYFKVALPYTEPSKSIVFEYQNTLWHLYIALCAIIWLYVQNIGIWISQLWYSDYQVCPCRLSISYEYVECRKVFRWWIITKQPNQLKHSHVSIVSWSWIRLHSKSKPYVSIFTDLLTKSCWH